MLAVSIYRVSFQKIMFWNFPGGSGVKNPPSNAGDIGSIPGWEIRIPPAPVQLNPCAPTTEPQCHNWREAGMEQLEKEAHLPQPRVPLQQQKDLACRKEDPECCNQDQRQSKKKKTIQIKKNQVPLFPWGMLQQEWVLLIIHSCSEGRWRPIQVLAIINRVSKKHFFFFFWKDLFIFGFTRSSLLHEGFL